MEKHNVDILTVEYDGKKVVINKRLLDLHDKWDKLPLIKAIHMSKMVIEKMMMETDDVSCLRDLDELLTEEEFRLQNAWGFDRDIKFHRFWDRPKCKCPKMDNDDRYPTGYYVIVSNCPLHGNEYE